MGIILYTIIFCLVFYLLFILRKAISLSLSNSAEILKKHSELSFVDTVENAKERYSLACEILEKYKPYITEEEYAELDHIIQQANMFIDIDNEREIAPTINKVLNVELNKIICFINHQRKCQILRKDFWDYL